MIYSRLRLLSYNGAVDILTGAFQLLAERPSLLPRLGSLWASYAISMVGFPSETGLITYLL